MLEYTVVYICEIIQSILLPGSEKNKKTLYK